MGDKAYDILGKFQLSPDDVNNFDVVIRKFDAFFMPKVNVVFERAFTIEC